MAFHNETSFGMNSSTNGVCSEDTPVFCVARTVSISIILGIISIVTVIGNIFVIVAYVSDPRIRSSVANTFILNLSISDFIIGAVSIPLNSVWVILGYWPLGKIPCQLFLVLDYTASNVAVIAIIFISLDRYWLLTMKLSYSTFQTHRRAVIMSVISWLVYTMFYTLVTFAWAPLAGVEMIDYDKECELEPYDNIPFVATQLALEFLVPLLVIVHLNVIVYINIKRRSKGLFRKPRIATVTVSTVGPGSGNSESEPGLTVLDNSGSTLATPNIDGDNAAYSNTGFVRELGAISIQLDTVQSLSNRTETGNNTNMDQRNVAKSIRRRGQLAKRKEFKRHRKAAIILSVLVSVFIVFWLPYHVVSLLGAFCEDCVSDLAWEVVNYILWCNSTVNPFLYAFLNKYFRQNFLRYLGLKKLCSKYM